MPITLLTFIFFSAFLITLMSTPIIRNWANEKKLVDKPSERKIHSDHIPRIGGIAILMGFLIPLFLFASITAPFRGLILGGLIIFATGLLDDLFHLSSKQKFIGQILACLVAVFIGKFYLSNLGNFFGLGEINLPLWAAIPFTLFAIVGVSNALNLIDGLDGLAGGISSIVLIAFHMLAYETGNVFVLTVSAALLGAMIGFLKHNLYPARIFMGDGGSLFCGFVLAILSISLTLQEPKPIPAVLPLVVLGVPILDTLWVMTRRLRLGFNPFIADRTHLHHKFLDLGFQHRFTVVIIYSITWLWSIAVIAFPALPDYIFFYGYVVFTLCLYVSLRYVLRHKNSFRWLQRDSMAGLRDSVTFKRLSESTNFFLPLITLLLAAYPLAAILVQGACCNTLWPYASTLLLLLGVVHLPYFNQHKGVRLTLSYFAILLIIYVIRTDGTAPQAASIPAYRVADLILFAGLLLTAISVFLKSQWEHFFTSMDSLLMGASLLLTIYFLQQTEILQIPGILLRGMVYYQGLKVLQLAERRGSSVVFSAIVLTLAFIALRPLFNL